MNNNVLEGHEDLFNKGQVVLLRNVPHHRENIPKSKEKYIKYNFICLCKNGLATFFLIFNHIFYLDNQNYNFGLCAKMSM